VDDQQAFLRACGNHAPEVELRKAAAKFETDPVAECDAELLYQNAEVAAFCGQGDAALRELRKAIQGRDCSYPALDKDPTFRLYSEAIGLCGVAAGGDSVPTGLRDPPAAGRCCGSTLKRCAEPRASMTDFSHIPYFVLSSFL
jgi:hypothetical protein